jgi:16S rRNA (guanine966-N2)-methyltransferase
VRVIGGEARGRRLKVPPVPGLRPSSDRVREAIFDILESRALVEGARFVDLFAGSGALGIEALSRGADAVTFVESDRRAIAAIQENLEITRLSGPRGRAVRADALAWAASHGHEAADVVIADPPYEFEDWPALLETLSGAATVLLEHRKEVEVGGGFDVLRRYRYGGTLVTLAARTSSGPPDATDKDSD